MNKHLKSKIRECTGYYLTDTVIKNYCVAAPIRLKTIYNLVTCESRRAMKGYKDLCDSLAQDGMQQPCIIIELTIENLALAKRQVKVDYLSIKSTENCVWLALNGNSRITFANDYLYDTIDCFKVHNIPGFHSIQLELQKGKIIHDMSA